MTGCGPTGDAAGAPASNNPSAPSGRPTGPGGFGNSRLPGVYGLVAAVQGNTAQVQSQDSQTAVSWTSTTTFTAVSTGSADDVGVGDCVFVRTTESDSSAPATPAGGTTTPTSVTASSVQVSHAPKDGCTRRLHGRSGAGAGRPNGAFSPPADGTRPSGMPSRPAGSSGGPGAFGGVDGTVTKVDAHGFEVRAVTFPREGDADSPSASASPQRTTVRVHTSDSTTYTAQKSSTASAVKVGHCLQAEGKADSTGAVTATSITVTPSENGACTSGFGGQGAGFGGPEPHNSAVGRS